MSPPIVASYFAMNEPAKHDHSKKSGSLANEFRAEGLTQYVRLSEKNRIEWKTSQRFTIEASGGLLCTPTRIATGGKGTYRLIPVNPCFLQVEYDRPLHLLKYERFREILRSRYDIPIAMNSQWQENLWPYLFDHYIDEGDWPLAKHAYWRIFKRIFTNACVDGIFSSSCAGWLGKFRRRFDAGALTRRSRMKWAGRLADEAGRISHSFQNFDFFLEAQAEAEIFRHIPEADCVIPLAATINRYEINIKHPFEIPSPSRIMIHGLTKVKFKWEYGEEFEDELLCSSLELYPTAVLALASSAKIFSSLGGIRLESGGKKLHGTFHPAPITCWGKKAAIEILETGRSLRGNLRKQAGRRQVGTLDMRVVMCGTEG